ncbi:MAG TPA: hypothetical protein EYQ63_26855, partial [Fuerstia sp.]|nr:hypothetical protein [Fuerstiella sp.]
MEDKHGGANVLAFDGQNWKIIKCQKRTHYVLSAGTDRLYFSVGEKLYLYSPEREAPMLFAQSPLSGAVTRIRHQANGDIWFLQDGQTLRYRPRKTKPRPVVRLPASKIMSGDDTLIPITFSGLNRFEPHSDPAAFNYSWRIDDGAWSAWTDTPGDAIPLGNLPTGDHVFQLKAINSAGMVSDGVAEAAFSIHPLPIQERPRFLPVVALTLITVCGLALAATTARVKLKTYADGLERLGQDRTAELRDRQHRETELAENKLEKLRTKLVRQTQLATIGQMTASIAHEIRNPLGAVRNAAYYIKRHISSENP